MGSGDYKENKIERQALRLKFDHILMKRIYKIILFTLVLAAVLLAGIFLYLQQLKPQYSGERVLEGLKQQVDVYFDSRAVPHIYARNEADAYFALGYVHAQERLFQMKIMRRIAAGSKITVKMISGANPLASSCSLLASGFWRFESSEYQCIALVS